MNKPIPTRSDPWARWAKILLALIVSATLLALAGCSPASATSSGPDPVSIFEDRQTGCQYLAHPYAHTALTPRLGRDGKQVCK